MFLNVNWSSNRVKLHENVKASRAVYIFIGNIHVLRIPVVDITYFHINNHENSKVIVIAIITNSRIL